MNRRTFAQLLTAAALAPTTFAQSPKPRFSVMLWALARQLPFDRCLEIVSQAGYQSVELVGEFHKWSPTDTQRFNARLQELHLTVDSMSGVDTGFALPDQSTLFLQQFTEQLRWARALNCPQIILLSGKLLDSVSPAAQRQASIDNLKRASELAAEHNIEIVIEPIDRLENPTIYLSTVADAFDIVRSAARPNLKVLYDLFHEQRDHGNLLEKLTKNIDLIGLIHIADVPGRNEPGTGEINFANIYRELARLHYSRYLAMEFYPTHDPVATLRNAREEAQRYL
ncbi:hydroxypyruvate isomerase family protein [Granulicella paludicola]|uniref:hydroxypyruvate isomerase family protein n=1 Tax=Granulicella paludicola TaxID=474951 RepID=UPI0021DF73E1|nr:TIM barrel protein [Granulicella paludicola]